MCGNSAGNSHVPFFTNNHAPRHLWQGKESKSLKILSQRLSVKLSVVFITTTSVKDSHILTEKHFIFLKKHSRPNLKVVLYQTWTPV